MAIPWVRVDSNWYANPKFLQLRHEKRHAAITAYFGGLGWTADHERDGEIPAFALAQFGASKRDGDALVKVGLWEKTADGYAVNDYAEYQPTSEQRKARREKGRESALRRWNGDKSSARKLPE